MPKETPISLKPGAERLERIDAHAKKTDAKRHGAIIDLIDLGLTVAEGKPAEVSLREVQAQALIDAQKSAKAKTGVAVEPAARLPGAPETPNQQAERINAEKEARNRLWSRLKPAPKGGSK